jgi:hypothetical protein
MTKQIRLSKKQTPKISKEEINYMTSIPIREINIVARSLIDLQDRQHNDLTDRDAIHAHPASAIDGIPSNSGNLLANITPVFSGWIQNPGTNADITNETDNTLTTSGIASNTTESTIIYDLGSSKRIILYAIMSNATFSPQDIYISNNGINYYSVGFATTSSGTGVFIAKTRYIKYNDRTFGATYPLLGFRAYIVV